MRFNDAGQRWCPRRQHWVNPQQFYTGKTTAWCKPCMSEYHRQRNAPKKPFRSAIRPHDEIYNLLFFWQRGRCALCKQLPKHLEGQYQTKDTVLLADHTDAGRPRGLLCAECTAIVQWLQKHQLRQPGILKALEKYLEEDGILHLVEQSPLQGEI